MKDKVYYVLIQLQQWRWMASKVIGKNIEQHPSQFCESELNHDGVILS